MPTLLYGLIIVTAINSVTEKIVLKQGSIPVGCVLPASAALSGGGGFLPRGCLAGGVCMGLVYPEGVYQGRGGGGVCQIDACEKIIFSELLLRAVKIQILSL